MLSLYAQHEACSWAQHLWGALLSVASIHLPETTREQDGLDLHGGARGSRQKAFSAALEHAKPQHTLHQLVVFVQDSKALRQYARELA